MLDYVIAAGAGTEPARTPIEMTEFETHRTHGGSQERFTKRSQITTWAYRGAVEHSGFRRSIRLAKAVWNPVLS